MIHFIFRLLVMVIAIVVAVMAGPEYGMIILLWAIFDQIAIAVDALIRPKRKGYQPPKITINH